jgi:hypothetical protein
VNRKLFNVESLLDPPDDDHSIDVKPPKIFPDVSRIIVNDDE